MNLMNSVIVEKKEQILTPALLVDLDAMEANIADMAEFYKSRSTKLRPHFKTHKSPIIAKKQIEAGAIGITCAKLSEAEVLLDAGISSILIANQVVEPIKIMHMAQLARQNQLIVAVDSVENIHMISKLASEAGSEIDALVEVNVGLNRSGVKPGTAALDLAKLIHELPGIRFMGVLGYEGHAVLEPESEVRASRVEKAMGALVNSSKIIREAGIPVEIVSAGGTGTYDLTGDFPGITEVEAGSYLFMDTRYQNLELPFRQSVTLLATIISIPTKERAIIDSGMKSISSDNGLPIVVSPLMRSMAS
jgi:D-serine deaminase-like pyridoxal phosphate-dependent protein